jgi:aminoglycoside phosphotransferase (APT) family kinase protein
LHGLATDGLPVRANGHWLAMAQADWQSIALYLPGLADRLAPALRRLNETMPSDEAPAFCHGDFVCSQVLVAGERWSITDFDLCHAGDPVRDAAMFLATLPFDAPAFRDSDVPGADHPVARVYLDGWSRARRSRPDPRRLAWHGLCATLYVLALMLKKNRWSEPIFAMLERNALCHAGDLGSDR